MVNVVVVIGLLLVVTCFLLSKLLKTQKQCEKFASTFAPTSEAYLPANDHTWWWEKYPWWYRRWPNAQTALSYYGPRNYEFADPYLYSFPFESGYYINNYIDPYYY